MFDEREITLNAYMIVARIGEGRLRSSGYSKEWRVYEKEEKRKERGA